jgi:hypothetical protein
MLMAVDVRVVMAMLPGRDALVSCCAGVHDVRVVMAMLPGVTCWQL